MKKKVDVLLGKMHTELVTGESGSVNRIDGHVSGYAVQAHAIHDLHFNVKQRDLVTPKQLPAPSQWFYGRDGELSDIDSAMARTQSGTPAIVIAAIAGVGGIGKTALALHWAYRNASRFPDGQLYVNLRGFDPTGVHLSPTAAIDGFLSAFGVDSGGMPYEFEAKVALYRSLISGRHILIVLDNARNFNQIEPLLPGGSTCAVIVTSRSRMSGLTVNHGAAGLVLGELGAEDSRAFFSARIGRGRLDAEPEAVEEILSFCGGFPLALSIAASRAIEHSNFPLVSLAVELRNMANRLSVFDEEDSSASLPAVLSWSYRGLEPELSSVFRYFGMAPGQDISFSAITQMIGVSEGHARRVLRRLEGVSLVQQYLPGRYKMHDLVKLFAAERAGEERYAAMQYPAMRRLVDFYLHSAYNGDQVVVWHYRESITLQSPVSGVYPCIFTDVSEAVNWFDVEHACLLAIQQWAFERKWYADAWQLAWSMDTYHWTRGHLNDGIAAWEVGLTAARELKNPDIEAMALRNLGDFYAMVGRYGEADLHINEALRWAEHGNNASLQLQCQQSLMRNWQYQSKTEQSLACGTRALRLAVEMMDPVRKADILDDVAWDLILLGRYEQARKACEEALLLHRQNGHTPGEGVTLRHSGYLAQIMGDPAEALRLYRQALANFQRHGNEYFVADTLGHIAETYAKMAQGDEMRKHALKALEMYQLQFRASDAERMQRLLDVHVRPPESDF
ncbi:tetratricopeptide repeat protein [Amycolatopsis sp. NPDC003861]